MYENQPTTLEQYEKKRGGAITLGPLETPHPTRLRRTFKQRGVQRNDQAGMKETRK